MTIDYNQLDDDIIELVQLLNTFDGIETTFSCAGHSTSGYVTGYIQFTVEDLDALSRLLQHLPHSQFGFNRPAFHGSQITVRYHDGLQFTLHLGGHNRRAQREWLEQSAVSLEETCRSCRKNENDH